MLDTVIVGGGLCGLALAGSLNARGSSFVLFEARARLGGRILTVPDPLSGTAIDLGPAWFWPETQPRMARLVEDLGLASFPQWDRGKVLRLAEAQGDPEAMSLDSVHGGARRLAGGMGSLVEALSARVPAEAVKLEHELIEVVDAGDHVTLYFRRNERSVAVQARTAVLALPPRLLEQRVRFTPALDVRIREAMRGTPTWMAAQAKAVVRYPRAFWQERELSGSAFALYPEAILGEIYDASDEDSGRGGLGGFLALAPELRAPFVQGMGLLVQSQLARLYGHEAEEGDFYYQDWAEEPYTCSTLDLEPPAGHPDYGHRYLRLSHWNDKLYFGGTETAAFGGGYLEGALEAAGRVRQDLARQVGLAA
jgi:monoamine oxidase